MKNETTVTRLKIFLVPVILILGLGLMLFLPAGSFGFWQARIFWGEFTVLTMFIAIYFIGKTPDLLARRSQFKQDKTVSNTPWIVKHSYLGYIVSGFDFRFHWSSVPVVAVIAGNMVFILGYLLIIAVFNENRYAATAVTVEKSQTLITTGPYKVVRHPMYLGMLMMSLSSGPALGSYWAVLPFLFMIPFVLLRIKDEEELLQRELPGYAGYCAMTRYRLLPWIW